MWIVSSSPLGNGSLRRARLASALYTSGTRNLSLAVIVRVCGVVGARFLFGVDEGGWLFLSPRSCWRGLFFFEIFCAPLGFVVDYFFFLSPGHFWCIVVVFDLEISPHLFYLLYIIFCL